MSPVVAKEHLGMAVLVINIVAKGDIRTYVLYITNKTEYFSIKSGCVVTAGEAFKRRRNHSVAIAIAS